MRSVVKIDEMIEFLKRAKRMGVKEVSEIKIVFDEDVGREFIEVVFLLEDFSKKTQRSQK